MQIKHVPVNVHLSCSGYIVFCRGLSSVISVSATQTDQMIIDLGLAYEIKKKIRILLFIII